MTTREQIIAAAKEAGIHENWNPADWYQVSPEQLPIFYNIAYEAGAASRDAEIADLKRELDNEQARDTHSCHPNCSRKGCVNRRLRAELAAAIAACKAKDEALLTCQTGDYSTGHVIHPSFDEILVERAIAIQPNDSALKAWLGEPVAYRHLLEDGYEYYDAPTGEDCDGCESLYSPKELK